MLQTVSWQVPVYRIPLKLKIFPKGKRQKQEHLKLRPFEFETLAVFSLGILIQLKVLLVLVYTVSFKIWSICKQLVAVIYRGNALL